MPIVVQLDVMLARRKVKSKALAEYVGITEVNMSLLKQGKVKGVRFETLEKICSFLDCQPGDLLVYVPEGEAPDAGRLRDDLRVGQHDAARAFHGAVLPAMNEGPAVLVKPPRLARESRRPHGKLHLQLPNEKCDEKL